MIRKAVDCTSLHIICGSVAVRRGARGRITGFLQNLGAGLTKNVEGRICIFSRKNNDWEIMRKIFFFRECRSFTIIMVVFIVYTICGNCLRKQLPSRKPPLHTTESFEDNMNKLAYRYIQLRGRTGFIRISIEWPPTFQLCYVPGVWKINEAELIFMASRERKVWQAIVTALNMYKHFCRSL